MSMAADRPLRTRERGSLLAGMWHLEAHGQTVDNVEGLCRSVLERAVRGRRVILEPRDYEETLAWLLGEVWVQTAKYDAAKGTTLGPFLYQRLGWRLLDYWEKTYGANGEKRVVDLRADDDDRPGDEQDGIDRRVRRLDDASTEGEPDRV